MNKMKRARLRAQRILKREQAFNTPRMSELFRKGDEYLTSKIKERELQQDLARFDPERHGGEVLR